MPKAYWISTYQKIIDDTKMAAYATLAGPAISSGGGRFLARGMPEKVYEAGIKERTVLIEFDSVDAAINTHDSPAYAEALSALDGGAVREIRIVEAAEQLPINLIHPKLERNLGIILMDYFDNELRYMKC